MLVVSHPACSTHMYTKAAVRMTQQSTHQNEEAAGRSGGVESPGSRWLARPSLSASRSRSRSSSGSRTGLHLSLSPWAGSDFFGFKSKGCAGMECAYYDDTCLDLLDGESRLSLRPWSAVPFDRLSDVSEACVVPVLVTGVSGQQ